MPTDPVTDYALREPRLPKPVDESLAQADIDSDTRNANRKALIAAPWRSGPCRNRTRAQVKPSRLDRDDRPIPHLRRATTQGRE
jgi:hypothetical protein